MNTNKEQLLLAAVKASLIAGKEILDVYSTEDFQIQHKKDDSPLTIADQRAHNAIVDILNPLNIPIISEEGDEIPYQQRKDWNTCWIIDPLDGTKEFIKRNDEFTVNIALCENNKPVLGVIYIPVYKQLYFADIDKGAYLIENISSWNDTLELLIKESKQLPLDKTNKEKYTVVASRSHMNDQTKEYISNLETKKEIEILSKGSSLKLCMIALGEADVYPRFAPTMEWDIIAGHAIINAAGKKIYNIDMKTELSYNKENLLNPFFICK